MFVAMINFLKCMPNSTTYTFPHLSFPSFQQAEDSSWPKKQQRKCCLIFARIICKLMIIYKFMNCVCGWGYNKYPLVSVPWFLLSNKVQALLIKFRLFSLAFVTVLFQPLFLNTYPITFFNLFCFQTSESICCPLYTLNSPPSCLYSTLFSPCNPHITLHILILFTQLVRQYLLKPCYVPGTGLGAESIMINKTISLMIKELTL